MPINRFNLNEPEVWIIYFYPAGGGAGMKFWANLDNWAKYGLKAVQTVTGGIEQGNNVGKEI